MHFNKRTKFETITKRLILFPWWWFVSFSRYYSGLTKRLILKVDDILGMSLSMRLLFTPLYRDYTPVGIFLGPIIRFVRVVIGAFVLVPILLLLISVYLLWLAGPLMLTISLSTPEFLSFWGLIFGVGIVSYVLMPMLTDTIPPKKSDNLYDYCSRATRKLLTEQQQVGELLNKMWQNHENRRLFERINFTEEKLTKIAPSLLDTVRGEDLARDAQTRITQEGRQIIKVADIFVALVSLNEKLLDNLSQEGITVAELFNVVWWINQEHERKHPPTIFSSNYKFHPKGGVNRSWSARPTPTLNKVSQDFTTHVQAGKVPFLMPRDAELSEIVGILSRANGPNVLLIGEPGCGKTSMMYLLAKKIIEGANDKVLWDKRVVVLDSSGITSGSANRGEIEQKCNSLLDEVENAGNVLLCVPEIHTMLSMGEDSQINPVFAILKKRLTSKKFSVIASTTPAAFTEFIEPDKDLVAEFHRVDLPAASKAEVLPMLQIRALVYEKELKGLIFTYQSLARLVDLADRLIHDRVFPDKGFDLLESVAQAVSSFSSGHLVTAEDVEKTVAEVTSIPVGMTSSFDRDKLLNLEKIMSQKVIGQKDAITRIADILRRARVGVVSPNRPIGSLLIAGPTGVGKTEIARVLSEVYYGAADAMVRLDMSEFQGSNSVARLIGGMMDSGEQFGLLTENVRRKPYCLVLLDELEKASSGVLDIFLQILEDGRATDGRGNVVDFSNTLIYATSNIGAQLILDSLSQGVTITQLKPRLDELLFSTFRPEFLNRFDGIAYAQALTAADIEKIAVLRLNELAMRLKQQHGIILRYQPDFIKALAQAGYSPSLGARPLRRVLQDQVESALAKGILAGNIKKGGSVVLTPKILIG